MDAATSSETSATQPTSSVNIPNPDKYHSQVEMKFGFRTQKDEKTGTEYKRPNVEAKVNVLNFDGIVRILNDYASRAPALAEGSTASDEEKAAALSAKRQYDLLMGSVQGTYESAIKDYLGDNPQITSETFPYDLFTWEALANQPESERRGRGIAKEVWEDFIKSYVAI